MKLFFRLLLLIGLFGGLFSFIYALSITPNSGTFTTGTSTTFTLRAILPGTPADEFIDKINIDLLISGGTVTGYTDSADPDTTTVAACVPEGTEFTDTRVCVNLTKTVGYFTDNEEIGSFTVLWGTAGSADVTRTDNNVYIDQVNVLSYTDAGLAGSFTISAVNTSTPTPTPTSALLPPTGISDGGLPITIGAFLAFFGLALYSYTNQNYRLKNKIHE